MGAQNLNFTFKFPQNEGFQPQISHFGTTIFHQEQNFPTII